MGSALLFAAAGGCGGDDDPERKGPEPNLISELELNRVPLNTPRTVVERRLGRPSNPKRLVPDMIRRGEPPRHSCVYYRVKGGGSPRRDFAQLCFKGGELQSKLSLVASQRG